MKNMNCANYLFFPIFFEGNLVINTENNYEFISNMDENRYKRKHEEISDQNIISDFENNKRRKEDNNI